MSRLELRLIATHPDRAAGLGFVGDAQRFFWIIVSAFAFATAGVLADEIVYAGVPLASYWFAIAGYVALVLIVFLLPLTMFSAQMSRARIRSMHDYSAFAVLHNRMFDEKITPPIMRSLATAARNRPPASRKPSSGGGG